MPSLDHDLAPLVAPAFAGDDKAYRRLLEGLAVYLRGHVRRLVTRGRGAGLGDVEDIVQEVLIAVHTRRHTYDASYPFSVWVHAIARYKTIDHLRRNNRGGEALPIEDFEHLLSAGHEGSAEAAIDVGRLLDAVPAKLRGAFAAVKLEGRSFGEAAAAVGMSETALKVAIHRAMKRLSSVFGRA